MVMEGFDTWLTWIGFTYDDQRTLYNYTGCRGGVLSVGLFTKMETDFSLAMDPGGIHYTHIYGTGVDQLIFAI